MDIPTNLYLASCLTNQFMSYLVSYKILKLTVSKDVQIGILEFKFPF